MPKPLIIGSVKSYARKVQLEDSATFETGMVHPVYGTFALARDAEWCCRLFVLDTKTEDEEGIGVSLQIEHVAPAGIGALVTFTATLEEVKGSSLTCSWEAKVGDQTIAVGKQTQKILLKTKLAQIMPPYNPNAERNLE
jgi:fluoroacetyl-CoA thioesterase